MGDSRKAYQEKRNGAQGRIRTTDTRIFSLTNRLDIAYLFVSLGQTWDIVRLPVVDDRRGRRAQQRRLESRGLGLAGRVVLREQVTVDLPGEGHRGVPHGVADRQRHRPEIGRASCRERVCQDGWLSVMAE